MARPEQKFDGEQLLKIIGMGDVPTWSAGLNPVMMEEWCDRVPLWMSVTREALVDFVRRVNDPFLIPVDGRWRDIYAGRPAVIWTVGMEDGQRFISMDYLRQVVGEAMRGDERILDELFEDIVESLSPSEVTVLFDETGIHVKVWWE